MHYLGMAFILTGSILILIGAFGCYKYKHFFHQLQAASVGDNGGLLLILIGLIICDGMTMFSAKILLLICIILITSPTNTHLMSRIAILSNIKPLTDDEEK